FDRTLRGRQAGDEALHERAPIGGWLSRREQERVVAARAHARRRPAGEAAEAVGLEPLRFAVDTCVALSGGAHAALSLAARRTPSASRQRATRAVQPVW